MHTSDDASSVDASALSGRLKEVRPWIRLVARIGFAAVGFIHIVVGVLAARLAAGLGGETESLRTALTEIQSKPFGGTLLLVLACGFLCHAAWMLVQAILDPDDVGRTRVGKLLRVGFGFTGMIFVGLAISAARIVLFGGDGGSPDENERAESATAAVLAQPFGQVLIMVFVGVLIAFAIGSLVQAWQARFRDQFLQSRMSDATQRAVVALGRLAYCARGLVFSAAAWLFAQAAIRADPGEAGGMSEAMGELLQQPYGRWLLGLAGAGFIAYGLFSWTMIRFRRLPGDKSESAA
jgi:hypothetical protein